MDYEGIVGHIKVRRYKPVADWMLAETMGNKYSYLPTEDRQWIVEGIVETIKTNHQKIRSAGKGKLSATQVAERIYKKTVQDLEKSTVFPIVVKWANSRCSQCKTSQNRRC